MAMSPLNVEILAATGKNGFSAIGESKVSTFNGDIAKQIGTVHFVGHKFPGAGESNPWRNADLSQRLECAGL